MIKYTQEHIPELFMARFEKKDDRVILRGVVCQYIVEHYEDGVKVATTSGPLLPVTRIVEGNNVAVGKARGDNEVVTHGFPLDSILQDYHLAQQASLDLSTLEIGQLKELNGRLSKALKEATELLANHGYILEGI